MASLAGCGVPADQEGAATSNAAPGAAASAEVLPMRDDPAMANNQPPPVDPEDADDEEIEEGLQAPSGLAIDHDAGLVFVPDIGWMDVPSFAALYLHEPEKLPGEFDHQAVHDLLKDYNN